MFLATLRSVIHSLGSAKGWAYPSSSLRLLRAKARVHILAKVFTGVSHGRGP